MKVLILAGGLGSRLAEETDVRPKPMVEIGGMPILWHIMKIYEASGFNDFVILLGYKGYVIKEFFLNYYLHTSDVCIDMTENKTTILNSRSEKWRVTLIDTGELAMTGARIRKAKAYTDNKPFMLTYGDGLANVDIKLLIDEHRKSNKIVTLTGVQPDGRFGALEINNQKEVINFTEKRAGDGGWINGGFFVCEPTVFDYLPEGDDLVFENGPLQSLARDCQINAFIHQGFWRPMDTLRDKQHLQSLWSTDKAPWKVW